MSKRDVSALHLATFREMLKSVEQFLPLDWDNIKLLLKKKWPKKHQSEAMLAVSGQVRDACMPFLPMVSLTSPEHHLSKKHPVIEFVLINQEYTNIVFDKAIDGARIPVSLSLFENGRQVLRVYGLRLDHLGTLSEYEKGQLLRDMSFVWHPKMVFDLIKNLVDSFQVKCEDHKSSSLQTQALEDLGLA